MVRFLLAHLFEHVRRRRIGLPQRIGKLTKNAPVLLLVLDGQRQNLFFRQVLELFLHCSPVRAEWLGMPSPGTASGTQQNRTFLKAKPLHAVAPMSLLCFAAQGTNRA